MICCGDNYKEQSKVHEWLRRLKVRWAMKEMKLSDSVVKDSSPPGRCDLLAGRVTDVSKYRTAFIFMMKMKALREADEEELYII
jgi:hypothetical protein